MVNNLNITNRSGLTWKHYEHCGIAHEVEREKCRSVVQIASVKTRNATLDLTEADSTQKQTGRAEGDNPPHLPFLTSTKPCTHGAVFQKTDNECFMWLIRETCIAVWTATQHEVGVKQKNCSYLFESMTT